MVYYLYMLRCEDGSIYIGVVKDYLKRYEEYLSVKGVKYIKLYKVVKIERVFLCDLRLIVCSFESEIKKYIKKKKENIISKLDSFIKDIENVRKIKIKKIF